MLRRIIMKLRILCILLALMLLIPTLSACTDGLNESSADSLVDTSDVNDNTSGTVSEPEAEREPDFFEKLGHTALPDSVKIPDICKETDTPYLYLIDIDYSEYANADVVVQGRYAQISYWNEDHKLRILSLDSGEKVNEAILTDYSAWGSLEDGGVWVVELDSLKTTLYRTDGSAKTVLEPQNSEGKYYASNAAVTKDGKYMLAITSEESEVIVYDLVTKKTFKPETKGEYFWQVDVYEDKFFLLTSIGNVYHIDCATEKSESIEYDNYYSPFINGVFTYTTGNKTIISSPLIHSEYICVDFDTATMSDFRFGTAAAYSLFDSNLVRFYDLKAGTVIAEQIIEIEGFVSYVKLTDDGGAVIATLNYYGDYEGDGIPSLYYYDLPLAAKNTESKEFEMLICTADFLIEETERIAKETEEATGVDILYGSEGNDFIIYDYIGEAEKNPFTVYFSVKEVCDILMRFPNGMLTECYENTHKGLQIYLCGTIYGKTGSSLETAGGVTTECNGYIVIALDSENNIKNDLPHELSHAFDRRIEYVSDKLGKDYLQIWIDATPVKNPYEYSYEDYWDNTKYTSSAEYDEENIWFVDCYARTFPTEDRARIMEHLFSNENGELSDMLNYKHIIEKAKLYCEILRACFESCNTDDTHQWEIPLN